MDGQPATQRRRGNRGQEGRCAALSSVRRYPFVGFLPPCTERPCVREKSSSFQKLYFSRAGSFPVGGFGGSGRMMSGRSAPAPQHGEGKAEQAQGSGSRFRRVEIDAYVAIPAHIQLIPSFRPYFQPFQADAVPCQFEVNHAGPIHRKSVRSSHQLKDYIVE